MLKKLQKPRVAWNFALAGVILPLRLVPYC
jgi:hypothetical protein